MQSRFYSEEIDPHWRNLHQSIDHDDSAGPGNDSDDDDFWMMMTGMISRTPRQVGVA